SGLADGVGADDIDAAVCWGRVDRAAAVDYYVRGLVDELGRYWAAAFLGVIGDEVPGDVRVVRIADVVDLQAGVEVGEIDVPVVGRQAVQALLLVLVVRPESAALLAEARGVVTARRAWLGKQGHQDRVGLIGDVDGRDVGGGFVALLAQRLAVDDYDVAARQRHCRVHGDGAAKRRVDRQRGDVSRVVVVGDVE